MTTSIYSISCLTKNPTFAFNLPLQNQHFGTELVVQATVAFPTFLLVMCSPATVATIKSVQRGWWGAKQRSQMSPRATSAAVQPAETLPAAGLRACLSPSHSTGLLICQCFAAQAATGLQALQQALQNFMCFCFLATKKPSNNRNQNVNLKVQ